ncbi:MAG: hypothetical protein M1827_005659 [Pycnora praestabilis]|nr:MAG: hypothetical protein M1827_005659 [Pycnora praestabilis]
MNAILQTQFQRIETALNTLTDSIASYNPSTAAASELLSADDKLSQGLEQLAVHQANNAYINSLRSTSSTLDARIKSTLTLLASTRAELLATPATRFPPDAAARSVPYDELLSYAKRISKFTVPPTFRVAPLPAEPSQNAATANTGTDTIHASQALGSAPQVTNGTTTSASPSQIGASSTSAEQLAANAAGLSTGVGISSLAVGETQWLDPTSQMAFVPWPSEEVIRRGALAQIQIMLEQGQDPESALAEVGDTEAGEKGGNEGDEKEEGVKESELSLAAENVVVSQGNVAVAPPRRAEKPAVFSGLDLYDPDDE